MLTSSWDREKIIYFTLAIIAGLFTYLIFYKHWLAGPINLISLFLGIFCTFAITRVYLGFIYQDKLGQFREVMDRNYYKSIVIGYMAYVVLILVPELRLIKLSNPSLDNLSLIIGLVFNSILLTLIFILPFVLVKLQGSDKKLLKFYFIIQLILMPFINFLPFNLDKPNQLLMFKIQPSLLLLFGLVPWIIANLYITEGKSFFKWVKRENVSIKVIVIIGLIPIIITGIILGNGNYKSIIFSNLVLTAINFFLKAVQEEIFYRGFVFGLLKKYYSTSTSMLATTTFFSLIHWSNYIDSNMSIFGMIFNLVLIWISGFSYNWLYVRTNNLWYSILFHWLYNLIIIWQI